jgi:hypothetical protein
MTISLLALGEMESFVVRASIVLLIVFVAGLVLWHLAGNLVANARRKRRKGRLSPELESAKFAGPDSNDPPRLERACAVLVESLAEKYLALAKSWLESGQPQRAADALQKVIQRCPETRQAQIAKERLEHMGAKKEPKA